MKEKHTYYRVIVLSCLIHILLVWLLIFYTSDQDPLTGLHDYEQPRQAETVFYDEPPQSPFDDWAQLKPQASSLGPSRDAEPMAAITPGGEQPTLDESDTSDPSPSNPESQTDQPSDKNLMPTPPLSIGDIVPVEEKKSSSKPSQKSALKKKQAQKLLATLTKGYLEQLTHEGNNLIKTIGGDPDKLPTAEQLQYERYLARLQWCINNAHAIHQHTLTPTEPFQSTMKIYFTINTQGKMANFTIKQSSGNGVADKYIAHIFTYASSSFPPLPPFIKQDPFPLFYTVFINWNQGHNANFMRY